jgi:hypothetical protein
VVILSWASTPTNEGRCLVTPQLSHHSTGRDCPHRLRRCLAVHTILAVLLIAVLLAADRALGRFNVPHIWRDVVVVYYAICTHILVERTVHRVERSARLLAGRPPVAADRNGPDRTPPGAAPAALAS